MAVRDGKRAGEIATHRYQAKISMVYRIGHVVAVSNGCAVAADLYFTGRAKVHRRCAARAAHAAAPACDGCDAERKRAGFSHRHGQLTHAQCRYVVRTVVGQHHRERRNACRNIQIKDCRGRARANEHRPAQSRIRQGIHRNGLVVRTRATVGIGDDDRVGARHADRKGLRVARRRPSIGAVRTCIQSCRAARAEDVVVGRAGVVGFGDGRRGVGVHYNCLRISAFAAVSVGDGDGVSTGGSDAEGLRRRTARPFPGCIYTGIQRCGSPGAQDAVVVHCARCFADRDGRRGQRIHRDDRRAGVGGTAAVGVGDHGNGVGRGGGRADRHGVIADVVDREGATVGQRHDEGREAGADVDSQVGGQACTDGLRAADGALYVHATLSFEGKIVGIFPAIFAGDVEGHI